MTPDNKTIKTFRTATAFEKWLSANHDRQKEVWLKIHRSGSGLPSITLSEALDVALCWGWIDGIRKSLDTKSFLQRYSPRTAKSLWSQINKGHVARLIKAGRMTPHGQKQIDAAKADGRWKEAYAPLRSTSIASIPADLRTAINVSPRARANLKKLSKMQLFSLIFRTNNMKTAAGRARKIQELVAKLARGESIGPGSGSKDSP